MRLGSFIVFVSGFALARGLLLLSPILLANLLPLAEYGQLELAHSYAVIAAVLFGLGLPSSVPLVLLRSEVSARWDTLIFLCILIAILALLVTLGSAIFTNSLFTLPTLVPLLVAVLILQQLWATTLKTQGAGTQSVFIETGLWTAAVCGALFVSGWNAPDEIISIMLFSYCCLLLACAVRRYLETRAAFGLSDLLANVRVGAPLMATVALSMSTASAGRLVLGSVADVTNVGSYAVLYRSTMLPLVGHQVLMIALFRQMFTWEDDELKRRLAILPACVTVGVLVFWLLAGRFGFLLGQRFVDAYADHRLEAVVVLCQTILWSAVAQNDLLVTRLQFAGHVAWRMFFVLLITLPGLVLLSQSASPSDVLRTFVIGYSALTFVYYIVQCIVIARRGHRFLLLWSTATIGFLASAGIILAFEWSTI